MSIIELPYERREKGTKAPLDKSLVNYILGRFAKKGMVILDPFAGDRTIEKCACEKFAFAWLDVPKNPPPTNTTISLDIKDGYDARKISLQHESIDLIFTHPPYWKAKKYTDDSRDLSNAKTYKDFLKGFDECLGEMSRVLKKKGYLILVIGDFREKGRLYPLHSDVVKDAWMHNLILKAIWIHKVTSGRVMTLGIQFIMGHDYVLVLQKT